MVQIIWMKKQRLYYSFGVLDVLSVFISGMLIHSKAPLDSAQFAYYPAAVVCIVIDCSLFNVFTLRSVLMQKNGCLYLDPHKGIQPRGLCVTIYLFLSFLSAIGLMTQESSSIKTTYQWAR